MLKLFQLIVLFIFLFYLALILILKNVFYLPLDVREFKW